MRHVQSTERLPGGVARKPQPGAGFQLRKIRYDRCADRREYVRVQRAERRQGNEPEQNDPIAEAGRGCQGRSQECGEASKRGFERSRILGNAEEFLFWVACMSELKLRPPRECVICCEAKLGLRRRRMHNESIGGNWRVVVCAGVRPRASGKAL